MSAATKLSDLAVDSYLLPGDPHERTKLERCGQITGPDKWAVRWLGRCLNRDGAWELEPLPSSRDDAFLARCRFDTPEAALATWDRHRVVTAEEQAAEEAELVARFERMQTAREGIVAHLGGKWKRGKPSARGRIDCPACGKPQALAFARSGYNGHITAKCDTPGCCSWME